MSEINPTPTGRDSKGRFTKGNIGGPGNPHARQVAELRKRLLEKVTPEEMDAIIDAMLKRAREGDVSAAKLILQYTLGKPLEAANPDRLDADEADAFFSNALTRQSQQLAQVQPLDLMLPLFRIAIAARGNGVLEQFAEQFVDAFGADGQQPERDAARPRAAEGTPPHTPASPKRPAVTKRKQTESAPTPAPTRPDDPSLSADTKRGQSALPWPEGLPPAPPLPPVDAVRHPTVDNGPRSASRTRARVALPSTG